MSIETSNQGDIRSFSSEGANRAHLPAISPRQNNNTTRTTISSRFDPC
jgi:hypothetical protein